MLPNNNHFRICPSVLCAHKETILRILPEAQSFLFKDEIEYTLTVYGVAEDIPTYKLPTNQTVFSLFSKNGVLEFPFSPKCEGEWAFILKEGEKILFRSSFYSVEEDIYPLRALKGDLHTHSFRSDGALDPVDVAAIYRSQGFDFVSLTDHNRFYPGFEIDETFKEIDTGLLRVAGEEVHAPNSPIHIVRNGGERPVSEEYYVENEEEYFEEIAKYEKKVPDNIPEEYIERYARAMWSCDKIHSAGGIATLAHPFWRPGNSLGFNINAELTRILLKSGMFDAFELVGGCGIESANLGQALLAELNLEGFNIPVVGSSDSHIVGVADQPFSNVYTVVFSKDKTEKGVIEAIKGGLCVAVYCHGYDYNRMFYCFGSFRLCAFARFLLTKYFPKQTEILESQGAAMRSYAMGNDTKCAVQCLSKMAERNYEEFFGVCEPILPSKELLDREEAWRERQRKGPNTKGSGIYGSAPNVQI